MTFVGAIIALRKHAHLGMDSVVSACLSGQEGLFPCRTR